MSDTHNATAAAPAAPASGLSPGEEHYRLTGDTDKLLAEQKPADKPASGDAAGTPTGDKPAAASGQPAATDPQTGQPAAAAAPAKDPAKDAADPAVDPDDEVLEVTEGTNKGRFVRHGALHRERELRKSAQSAQADLQKRYDALMQNQTRLDERHSTIMSLLQAQPGAQPGVPQPGMQPAAQPGQPGVDPDDLGPAPDANQDIFGLVNWQQKKLDRLEKLIASFGGQVEQVAQSTAQQTNETQVLSHYRSDVAQFSARNADFGAAYNHLLQNRAMELAYSGLVKKDALGQKLLDAEGRMIPDTDAIQKVLAREERSIVMRAIQDGESPAARLYTLAIHRGYRKTDPAAQANGSQPPAPAAAGGAAQQPPVASAQPAAGATAPAAGQPAAGAAQPSMAAAASAEIARIKAGQDAAQSLSNGGGSPAGTMTAAQLANLPQAEFNEWVRKNPRLAAQLAGGAAA